jgi:hypothetical protein
MDLFFKQSQDKLDYDTDYSLWLPDGDVIQLAEVSSDAPTDLVIDAIQWTEQVVKVWLTGGTNGLSYKITIKAYTSGGRIKETEFKLRVRDY